MEIMGLTQCDRNGDVTQVRLYMLLSQKVHSSMICSMWSRVSCSQVLSSSLFGSHQVQASEKSYETSFCPGGICRSLILLTKSRLFMMWYSVFLTSGVRMLASVLVYCWIIWVFLLMSGR